MNCHDLILFQIILAFSSDCYKRCIVSAQQMKEVILSELESAANDKFGTFLGISVTNYTYCFVIRELLIIIDFHFHYINFPARISIISL